MNQPTAEQMAELMAFIQGGTFETKTVWTDAELSARGSQSARHIAEQAELTAKWMAKRASRDCAA